MYTENIVTGIIGIKGSGKTTFLTYCLISEIVDNIKDILYCNYKVEINKFNWLNAFELIFNMDLFKNSCIGIDELHEYADSRYSSSNQNKRISDFFLQSRHTNANIYYSTQFLDQVDKRIQRITDIIIGCTNLKIDLDDDGDNDLFGIDIIDNRTRRNNFRYFYAKPMFNKFDTSERINPFLISKEREKKLKKKIEELNERKFKA